MPRHLVSLKAAQQRFLQVVIIDLGVAEMFSIADPAGRMIGGTPTTMAPEVPALPIVLL